MSTTIRQQIVTAVETRLKTISVANGYQTALGVSVNLCRPVKPTDAEAAVGSLNIWDIEDDVVPHLSGIHKHSLRIDVYITKTGSGAAAWMRKAVADISQAIRQDRKWSQLAIDTKPGKNEYELDQENKLTGTVRYPFTIEFYTLSFDDFTQP